MECEKIIMDESISLKEKGNSEMKNKNYKLAIHFYSEALKLNPINPIYYSNRSAAYYNIGDYENSLSDAVQSIELDPTFLKGYFRKAANLFEIDELNECIKTIEESKKIGIYPEIDKLNEKVLEEYRMDNILPSDSKEIKLLNNLKEWLKKENSFFPKLKMRFYSHNYRGVHASRRIAQNEIILFIPKDKLITLEMAKETSISKKIIAAGLELLSPKHTFLSTFILQELNNENSYWKPYLDILPKKFDSMPIFFNEEDLKWLEGSYLLTQINEKLSDLRKDYISIINIAPEFEMYSFEIFCWARMTASSRIFGIVMNNNKTDAFVPFADMLNHRRPKQTNWFYSDLKKGFIIEASENIEKGFPVYDSYGRKCNSRFLLNYGFIVENNDANEVAIKVYFDNNDILLNIKEKLLQQKPTGKIIRVVSNLEEYSSKEFLAFCRFVQLDNQDELNYLIEIENNQNLENKERNFVFKPYHTPPLSIHNEKKCLNFVKKICVDALNKYPTTINEDKEILKNSNLTFNQRNCVLIRIGEKEILHFYLDFVDNIMKLFESNDLKSAINNNKNPEYSNYIDSVLNVLIKKLNKQN